MDLTYPVPNENEAGFLPTSQSKGLHTHPFSAAKLSLRCSGICNLPRNLKGEKAQERNHMTIHSQLDIEERQHFLNVVAQSVDWLLLARSFSCKIPTTRQTQSRGA